MSLSMDKNGDHSYNEQIVEGTMEKNQIHCQIYEGPVDNIQKVGKDMKGNQENSVTTNAGNLRSKQIVKGDMAGDQINKGCPDRESRPKESRPCTRFTEVAELLQVWFFYIKISMNFLDLSANTKYGAYLIFKTTEDSEGLDATMNSSVSVGRNQEEKYVCLKPTTATPRSVVRPKEWSDEWFELELGQFYCDNVTNKEAVIIIQETSDYIKKSGLIVAGVEIHPI